MIPLGELSHRWECWRRAIWQGWGSVWDTGFPFPGTHVAWRAWAGSHMPHRAVKIKVRLVWDCSWQKKTGARGQSLHSRCLMCSPEWQNAAHLPYGDMEAARVWCHSNAPQEHGVMALPYTKPLSQLKGG